MTTLGHIVPVSILREGSMNLDALAVKQKAHSTIYSRARMMFLRPPSQEYPSSKVYCGLLVILLNLKAPLD